MDPVEVRTFSSQLPDFEHSLRPDQFILGGDKLKFARAGPERRGKHRIDRRRGMPEGAG